MQGVRPSLIGWWWGKRVMPGTLCFSLKLPSSTWEGALFLRRTRDTLSLLLLYTFLEEELELLLYFTALFFFFFSTALSLFFCLLSLPWLATVWICSFGRRRSRRPKPISYKQETGDTGLFCSQKGPAHFSCHCSLHLWVAHQIWGSTHTCLMLCEVHAKIFPAL